MTRQIPAERTLPNRQAIITRVLADEGESARRPAWLVPVAAAAAVAVVAGGLFAATTNNSTPRPGPAPVAGATTSGKPTKGQARPLPADVRINVGPLGADQAAALAKACLTQMNPGARASAITHPIRVMSWVKGKPAWNTVAVTDKSRNLRYGCDGPAADKVPGATIVGGDPVEARKHKTALNPPDATHPAAPTDGGGLSFVITFDKSPDLLAEDGWYRVNERVATMRQRWVVKGNPGPWYVADAMDGLVFLRSKDESTALKVGDQVRLETQVLGHHGELLDAPADQQGGGGLTPSPGTTRVDAGKVVNMPGFAPHGWIDFQ
jgi:hypothetical protein